MLSLEDAHKRYRLYAVGQESPTTYSFLIKSGSLLMMGWRNVCGDDWCVVLDVDDAHEIQGRIVQTPFGWEELRSLPDGEKSEGPEYTHFVAHTHHTFLNIRNIRTLPQCSRSEGNK